MNRKFINFLLKIGVIVAAYVVAAQYVDDQVLLYITIGISLTYVVYSYLKKKDPLEELRRFSNVNNYLRITEKEFAKDETKRAVYLAYGKVYEGKLEESKSLLHQVNVNTLKEVEELYHLYLQTMLRHAYHSEEKEDMEEIYKIALADQTIHPNTEQIAKVMMLMNEKKYQEALKVFLEIIPKENRRHVIMELEVMLAECYIALEQKEDAKAVLEFVASKKYSSVHVEKAKSLLVGLK